MTKEITRFVAAAVIGTIALVFLSLGCSGGGGDDPPADVEKEYYMTGFTYYRWDGLNYSSFEIYMTYDDDDRVYYITTPKAVSTVTFDEDGKELTFETSAPATYAFIYDGSGKCVGWNKTGGLSAAWTYDGSGKLVRVDLNDGRYFTYSYDASGEVESIDFYPEANWDIDWKDFTNSSGLPVRLDREDGWWATAQYDSNGNLDRIDDSSGDYYVFHHQKMAKKNWYTDRPPYRWLLDSELVDEVYH